MIIGKFKNADGGRMTGHLDTISGTIGLTFTPNSKGADYTVTTSTGCEAGAAWKKTSKDDKAYVSVKLDGPFLPAPLTPRCSPSRTARTASCGTAPVHRFRTLVPARPGPRRSLHRRREIRRR